MTGKFDCERLPINKRSYRAPALSFASAIASEEIGELRPLGLFALCDYVITSEHELNFPRPILSSCRKEGRVLLPEAKALGARPPCKSPLSSGLFPETSSTRHLLNAAGKPPKRVRFAPLCSRLCPPGPPEHAAYSTAKWGCGVQTAPTMASTDTVIVAEQRLLYGVVHRRAATEFQRHGRDCRRLRGKPNERRRFKT
jgi:hypothetical protein